ncbi:hypothetical protein LCGC14_1346780 [marine sediment metagenome]|uniref:Uncharacterized protein n=1 Tax=marine sediment metagenome TaxID=412755 RepID=A0A0F9KC48_9ZZZZ
MKASIFFCLFGLATMAVGIIFGWAEGNLAVLPAAAGGWLAGTSFVLAVDLYQKGRS